MVGAGVTTVLLHGFTGSSHAWGDGLVDGLVSGGATPVLVDLPGHGRHVGEGGPEHFTLERVFDLVDEAAAGGAVELVGYSMGGRMALAYAVRYPDRVRRLVLESASPGLATEEERARRRADDEALAVEILGGGIESFVDRWEGLPLFESQASLPARVRGSVRARRLLNDPRSLAASLRGLGTGVLPSYWGALETLPMPVLLVVGALDPKFVGIAREMQKRIPQARLEVVPEAGHAVHLERPDAWLAAVLSPPDA